MKRYIPYLLLVLLFGGCSEDETPLFIMEYNVQIPFFPESNTAKTLVIKDDVIISTFNKMLKENNLTADEIKTVRVRKAALSPLDHSYNYGILRRIEVNIFDILDPTDLLQIADLIPRLDEGRGEMLLLPGLPNVKSFVEKSVFGLDIGYSYRRPFLDRVDNQLVLELEAIGF